MYCRLCGNRLDEEHKKNEINNLMVEFKKAKQDFDTLKIKYAKAKSEYTPLETKLKSLQDKNNKLKEQQDLLRQEYKKVYEEKTVVSNDLNNYNYKFESLKKSLAEYKELKSKVITKPDVGDSDLKLKSEKLSKQIKKLTLEVKDYDELIKVFGNNGVKYHVLNLAIPYINDKIQEYMNVLSDGTLNAYITQDTKADGTKTDKLGIGIQSVSTADKFEDLSSGEKKRVSLALNIAFLTYLSSKVGGINIAVFDEVFDSLDASGIENVIKLLKKLSKKIGSIFVISHNSDLKYNDNFDKSLVVEKSNGLSILK